MRGSVHASRTAGRAPSSRLRLSRSGRLRDFAVSLERPEPLRYLLESLYPPHGRRERLRLALARRLPWRLAGSWVLSVAPEISGSRGGGEFPLLRELARRPELLERSVPGSMPLSWIATRRETDPASELVFLFPEGESVPTAVLELHRASVTTASGDEAGALRWLTASLSAPLSGRVPEVLFHVVREGLEVLALSALPGASAYVELRRKGASGGLVTRHLDAASDWLVPFQRETRSGKTWAPPPWSELAPADAAPAAEPSWWRRLRGRLERRPLPRVGRHGDFWARNLLLDPDDGPSAVVDWEAFRTNASPLDDLFDFALSYGELISGSRSSGSVDSFLGTFGRGAFPGPRIWTYVRRGLAGLGIEPDLDRSLLAVYLLDRARHAGVGPRDRLGRRRPASFWLDCFRRWRP